MPSGLDTSLWRNPQRRAAAADAAAAAADETATPPAAPAADQDDSTVADQAPPPTPTARSASRPPRRPEAAAGTTRPAKQAPNAAIQQYSDMPVPRPPAGPTVQRCYVLDADLDELLRARADVSGMTINQAAQQALDALLGDLNADRLREADVAPLRAAATEPARPIRRTLSIRAEHARVLRALRLRHQIQASAVVRAALAAHLRGDAAAAII